MAYEMTSMSYINTIHFSTIVPLFDINTEINVF